MKNITIEQVKDHIRNRTYMSGTNRDNARIKSTGEVFTPTSLVNEMLDKHPQELFSNPDKKVIDQFCGDGQFLGEVLIRKLENGIDFETALGSIYGVELMKDNVDLCKERLLCGQEHLRYIVDKNIICADALRYHYRFDGTDPYKTGQDLQNEKIFEIG